jgi:cobalt/nickel transport system permease protein
MSRLDTALAHLGALDALAARDTPASRLDARVKALAALAVAVTAASFGRGEALRLLPLAAWPVALGALGDVPWRAVLVRLAIASPFALGVAAFEPLLDRAPAVTWGGITLSAGAVAFVTIVLKFALALSAALVLVATTGFDAVCAALARLGAPRVVVTQLLLLYRYLFVLAEEATRMLRAHALRSPDRPRPSARTAGTLLGQLLLRTLDRGERLHAAMRCRGFDGELRLVRRPRLGRADLAFAGATALLLAGSRLLDLPRLLAGLLDGRA